MNRAEKFLSKRDAIALGQQIMPTRIPNLQTTPTLL
jgi:hypothetical protein